MSLSINTNDAICPRSVNYQGFAYTRKHINKKSVSYTCCHKKSTQCKCDAKLKFNRSAITGEVDLENKILLGKHTRTCCVMSGVDVKEYGYEGKSFTSETCSDNEENVHPNRLANAGQHVDKRLRLIDVSHEMRTHCDELAIGSLTLLPAKIWEKTKAEMDKKHPEGWTGIQKATITRRVRSTRMQMNGGDAYRTLENSDYVLMTDTKQPFLHYNATFPNLKVPGTFDRIMIFGNPSLFGLLRIAKCDLYIDATFDCCPSPFYQCLIIMILHKETNVYVPILYILMTRKTEKLYWQALNQVVSISEMELDANSYTSDFERAIINSCKLCFPEGFHIGCLFHLKQAWRRHLIKKLAFLAEEIAFAMKIGVLDLLCIIPQDEIREFGIPFVRSMIEEDLSAVDVAKWDTFWLYFESQWMPITDSWNICDQNGSYKNFMNRTNNGLESYNKRFNGLFPKHNPSLLEFVEIVEEESRYYKNKMNDIRDFKEARPSHEKPTIPDIPNAYQIYKQQNR